MTGSPAEGAGGSTELVNTGGGNGVGTCSVSVVVMGIGFNFQNRLSETNPIRFLS